MALIEKTLKKIERMIYGPKLNVLATLWLNFRLCNFCDAIHFPLFFYGKVFPYELSKCFTFPQGICRGMVRFGKSQGHFFAPSRAVFLLFEKGTSVNCYGKISFGEGVSLRLTRNANLVLRDGVVLGDNVEIMCEKKIEIGAFSYCTFGTKIIDTNFHYMVNLENGCVQRKNMPIVIGARNWIGNNATIMKGTVTAENVIVASGSLVNKDFRNQENIILAGCPAKVVKSNIRRIFSVDGYPVTEENIDTFFTESSDSLVRIDKLC